jgi:hypothetical protein
MMYVALDALERIGFARAGEHPVSPGGVLTGEIEPETTRCAVIRTVA